MSNFFKTIGWVLLAAILSIPSEGRAECDIRGFLVSNITSLQQSGSTELSFVLTASREEYDKAKTNINNNGSWTGPYGLFDSKMSYDQAQDKARKIAQATSFDYKNSYASTYFSQQASGKALDAYVECLNKDKSTAGLRLWLANRTGDFFTYKAFWVGSDLGKGVGKYDAKPVVNGVDIVSIPDAWTKGDEQTIILKRKGNTDFYLSLKVSGQSNAIIAVKDPPEVKWSTVVITSAKQLVASSHGPNPGCSGGSDNDCIYPSHPGGLFVSGTRVVSGRTSSDPGHYSETFNPDRSDQICVSIVQSTGACEAGQTAKGKLQAIETYPEAK